MNKSENVSYHNRKPINNGYQQVQFLADNDTRTYEERVASLPFVRNEDLPQWENWWSYTSTGLNHRATYNR